MISPSIGAISSATIPTHDEIAQCALDLWIESGRPEGRDDKNWLEAEARLISSLRPPPVETEILKTLAQPVTRPNPDAGLSVARRRR